MIAMTSTPADSSVLIVTDQLPYPPRNGITLPVYNYVVGLMKTQPVKVLLLADHNSPPSLDALADNERIFGKIEVVYLSRKGKLPRVLDELLRREMYNHGWKRTNQYALPEQMSVDIVLVSPMSAVAKWRSSGLQQIISCSLAIAAIHDCCTALYYLQARQSFGGLKLAIKSFQHRLRTYQIARIEAKLLAPYDHILLQTSTDLKLMRQLVSVETASHVVLVPNGVSADLFELTPVSENGTVLFVAELSGEYAPIADWLVSQLWPEVLKRCPECQLAIVGKGASTTLKAAIQSSTHITYIEFIEDLSQSYRDAMIVLSPIFKGYGLINKTIEAMAASVPVVGGLAAFNGIEGFQSGVHGMACNTRSTTGFADAIANLVSDPVRRIEMGVAGRRLLQHQFRWEFAIDKLQQLMRLPNNATHNSH